MSMPLWFYNLAIYCAQLAVLIAAGGLMVAVTRLREPRLRLIYWQVLLAMGALLPVIEPWQNAPKIAQGVVQAGESLAHAGSGGIDAAVALPARVAPSFSIYQAIAIVLVAGLLFRLVWLGAGLLRLRRSRLHANPLGPHAAVEQLKAALGISPAVLVSDRNSSPVTFGWRTPQILLPRKFMHMDEVRQRVILCHEFLHVRRRDWAWHVAEEVLRSLFWFHLAVVWLIAQIRLCREQLVDREVVILTGSRRDYLDALFEIASSSGTSRNAPALLFLSERHLKRRVKLILKETTMSRKKLALALTASLSGLLLTGVVVATLLPLRTSAAPPSSEVSLKAPTVRPDTHFFGNPDARLTVVEFGDFECPACRKAASVAEQVRKNMGAQVRFAYRQFPLIQFHHQAEKAAEAAECAAEQGKFWQAVNYLSDHPLDFSSSGIRQFAANLGLDPSRTMRCVSSGEMADRVQQDVRDGHALGVHSVPTLFIGDSKLVGMPSYSQLHALIEQKLHASASTEDTSPGGRNLLAAASFGPAMANELNGQETDAASQKPDPAPDPQAKAKQNQSNDSQNPVNVNINQDDIQLQIDEAMKHVQMTQQVPVKIDQEKLQEQIDQAMKQLKTTEVATPQIDEAKLQQQIEQAMKQAKMSQDIAPKIDQEKLQEQINQAMKQMEKLNTPEMRQHMQEQMEQLKKMDTSEMRERMQKQMEELKKLNTPEMRQHMQEQMEQLKEMDTSAMRQKMQLQMQAMEQLKKLNTPEMRQHMQEQMDQLKKMNTPEMRQHLKQAMEQAMMAQESAQKMNKDKIERQLEQARKEVEQARQEAQTAREEAQKARQDAIKARREAEEQRKAAKPKPSAEPKPVPTPPKEAAPAPPAPPAPPATPASPAPPKTPESAGIVRGVPGGVVGGVPGGIVGGVPGGVVGGVPGDKVTGIQGGLVKGVGGGLAIGVPGGITGGVITASRPPVPPSTSPKEEAPPPPASPAPSSPRPN